MSLFLTRLFSYTTSLGTKTYALIAVAIVLIAGGVWYMLSSGGEEDVIIVSRSDFVAETSVSGTVVAAQAVDLGFTQSGRVAGVYAAVGQIVAQGALLAQIENGDLSAAVLQKEAALETAQADLAELVSGTRPEEIAVSQAEVASKETVLSQANQALFDAILDAYTESDTAIRNDTDQIFDNPNVNPQLKLFVTDTHTKLTAEGGRTAMEGMLVAWNSALSSLSASADLSSATSLAEQNLTATKNYLAQVNTALNTAIPSTNITQTTINGYIDDVATARGNIGRASSALTTAVTAHKNAVTARTTAARNLELKEAGSTPAEISAQEARVKAAEADLANARAQLRKTLVVAPFSGIVTRMDAKMGEIISPNTPEIALQSVGTFQIESFVPEVNIAKLAVGNPAEATLDAYGPSVQFPARVVAIDPAETVRDGVSNYKTTLQFDAPDPRIRSGMTADVLIQTAHNEDTIVIPQAALYTKDGAHYVDVRVSRGRQARLVETGLSSLGKVEILSGLSLGEAVYLSPQ